MSLLMSSTQSTQSTQSSQSSQLGNSFSNSASHALSVTGKQLDKTLSLLTKNKYVFATLLVVLIMYAPYAAPKLNKHLEGILKNYAAKFVYIFVLSYLLTQSICISVVVSLVITLGAIILKKLESEQFKGDINKDNEPEVPRTLSCNEGSCYDAKTVSSPLCVKQFDEQNNMLQNICNDKPTDEPELNQPDFPGYVEHHNNNDNYTQVSDVTKSEPAHYDEYVVNKLGDEHESVGNQYESMCKN